MSKHRVGVDINDAGDSGKFRALLDPFDLFATEFKWDKFDLFEQVAKANDNEHEHVPKWINPLRRGQAG